VHAVVERTLREPPGAVTHWTAKTIQAKLTLNHPSESAHW
jgi:hypothetical protein